MALFKNGPLAKRDQAAKAQSAADKKVKDQIFGTRTYNGPKMGSMFGQSAEDKAGRAAWRAGVADEANYTTTKGGVGEELKLSGTDRFAEAGAPVKYASAEDSLAYAKGIAGGLGLPEDTRASMKTAQESAINYGANQAGVQDAQGMQASGMDDSGMALALNQSRAQGVGRDMAQAGAQREQDYANRMEGYRNALMGAAQNYAGNQMQLGGMNANNALQAGQAQNQADAITYQTNVQNPYDQQLAYNMGNANQLRETEAARRAGNMALGSSAIQGATSAASKAFMGGL